MIEELGQLVLLREKHLRLIGQFVYLECNFDQTDMIPPS